MKNFSKIIAIAALVGFGMNTAQASPINVGGVVWDPDAGQDMTAVSSIFENVTSIAGNTIGGIGRISDFNGTLSGTFCPGCELTYEFGGYTLVDLEPADGIADGTIGINLTSGDFAFTGGWLKVYVDYGNDFDPIDATTANNGALWLDLVAVANPVTLSGYTLEGQIDLVAFANGVLEGDGSGFFDVTGLGLADANFDTSNVFGTDADLFFNSDFAPDAYIAGNSNDGLTHSGSADLRGDTIPEPGTIALLGLGLIGMGAYRRKK